MTVTPGNDDGESGEGTSDHVERADPEGSIRSSINDGALLDDPLVQSVFVALGAPRDALEKMVHLSDEMRHLVTAYERWAPLARIGWAVTEMAHPDVYDRAADLLDDGKRAEADDVLEAFWNEPRRLEFVALRILRIAIFSEVRIEVGNRRHELVRLAVADHRAGRYHASIPVALAQTEGMLRDVLGTSPFQQPERLIDDDTRGGHPEILKPIFEASRLTMHQTQLDDSDLFPPRHGILHGRALGYDNRRNSTKALLGCAEVATFCQARILALDESGDLDILDRQVFTVG